VIALRLAKAGYWGGDPEKIMSARVDFVLDAFEFELFQVEYEDVLHEMNKPD